MLFSLPCRMLSNRGINCQREENKERELTTQFFYLMNHQKTTYFLQFSNRTMNKTLIVCNSLWWTNPPGRILAQHPKRKKTIPPFHSLYRPLFLILLNLSPLFPITYNSPLFNIGNYSPLILQLSHVHGKSKRGHYLIVLLLKYGLN